MALASANDALDGVGLKSLKITIGSTKSYKTDSIRFILTTFDHIESRFFWFESIWKPCGLASFILRSFPCSGSERRRMTSRWLGGTRPAVHVQPRGISTYIHVHKRDVQRIMETEIEWNIECNRNLNPNQTPLIATEFWTTSTRLQKMCFLSS